VDLEQFNFPEREFKEKKDLKYVFVGRLSWRKGADTLVEAWRQFVKDHPQCELYFFGIKDDEISLDNLPPNTFLQGWLSRNDLIGRLREMDVFVFPTTFEGSSTAVFQAMAMKLPVITTLNSGTVLKHGESCEIVKAGDTHDLVLAMNRISDDIAYRVTIAENAYLLSKKYTWHDYKTRLATILTDMGYL
jgi:glycosyltransferase involved in cell wall biosynthesis